MTVDIGLSAPDALYLDVAVTDLAAAARRAVDLGASIAEVLDGGDDRSAPTVGDCQASGQRSAGESAD
jgi:hypothetical protein